MFLEAKGWEMDTRAEYPCLGQDTDTANTIEIHFHFRVAKWVA